MDVIKLKNNNKRKYYFIGAVLFLLATCAVLIYFLAPTYLGSFFVFVVGGVMCWCSISIMIATYSCKEKVSAILVNYGFEQFKAHITSSPIFTYKYKGKTYTTKCADCLSQKYVLKHYKEGETYTIYLSEGNPSFIKPIRRIRLFDIILFLLGLTIIILSIVSVFLI